MTPAGPIVAPFAWCMTPGGLESQPAGNTGPLGCSALADAAVVAGSGTTLPQKCHRHEPTSKLTETHDPSSSRLVLLDWRAIVIATRPDPQKRFCCVDYSGPVT
jgi:hypothetical protein